MKCSQCGKELNESMFQSHIADDGTIKYRTICMACDRFNDIVNAAYKADPRTDVQQHIVDEATRVYTYQISNGLRPRGRLAREIARQCKRDTFFEDYVKANTPKEAK